MEKRSFILVRAGGVVCPTGYGAAPAHALVGLEGNERRPTSATLLAIGAPDEVARHDRAPDARVIDRPDAILVPGFVNAHAHLDLTQVGPRPHDPADGFVAWVDHIRQHRARAEPDIRASVRRGIELSLSAGVVAIGDIAGAPDGQPSLVPWQTQSAQRVPGVSFLEFFAIGAREDQSLARLDATLDRALAAGPIHRPTRLGVQPHAPNTVSPSAYLHAAQRAARDGLPLCTHLGETPEEERFVAHADGPQRELLERLGAWSNELTQTFGHERHPVAHLAEVLAAQRFLCVHLNHLTDEAIGILAATGAGVVYCPRASAYFEAERHFGAHRYRDLLEAGVPVCLGTDSIVCLASDAARTPQEGGRGMGVLDEARLLARRDGLEPRLALELGTTAGARALGLPPEAFTLVPDALPRPLAGLNLVPSGDLGVCLHESLIRTDAPCEFLFAATSFGDAGIEGRGSRSVLV